MIQTEVTGEGNLVRVKDPKFLSLVGKPANKMAFKVVRSDTEGETPMKTPVVRRQRRNEPSPIMRVQFPLTHTDEQVTSQMQAFGLVGYVVEKTDSAILATRADLKSISPETTVAVKLTADGVIATVSRGEQETPNPKSHLAITSLTFDSSQFDSAQVSDWLRVNGVEAGDISSVEGQGDFSVTRAEVPEGEESRTVQLQPGVRATIIRSDMPDMPASIATAVNEAAYGNWGWGHLDFAASMADSEFTEAMEDASYRLRSILTNILLYSALPLAERKTLMENALDQFKAFATGILDTLPRQVLVAVVRSASTSQEKPEMTQKDNSGAATTAAPTQTAQTADDKPVTRAEISAIATETVTAVLAAMGIKRADEGKQEGGEGKAPTEVVVEPAAPAVVGITREDVTSAVQAAVTPLVERLQKVEGTTAVRSDLGDSKVTLGETKTETKSERDVFRGAPVFGGLGLSTKRAAK